MELRKVNQETTRMYAKKEEITNKEMRKFTPSKWLTASAAGLVTLMYTSSSRSIHKIGVVFGCSEITDTTVTTVQYNYSPVWHAIDEIWNVFGNIFLVLGFLFVLFFIHYRVNETKYDENQRKKSVKHIKILSILLIISFLITIALGHILELDLSIFYLNGIK